MENGVLSEEEIKYYYDELDAWDENFGFIHHVHNYMFALGKEEILKYYLSRKQYIDKRSIFKQIFLSYFQNKLD